MSGHAENRSTLEGGMDTNKESEVFAKEMSVKIPGPDLPFKIDSSHISSESMIPVDRDILGLSFRSGDVLSRKFNNDILSRSFDASIKSPASP